MPKKLSELLIAIATYPTVHPLRCVLIGLVTSGVVLVGSLGNAWDYIRYALGTNYQYVVLATPSELRLGEEATASLLREYKKKDGSESDPVQDLQCAWFFEPA